MTIESNSGQDLRIKKKITKILSYKHALEKSSLHKNLIGILNI